MLELTALGLLLLLLLFLLSFGKQIVDKYHIKQKVLSLGVPSFKGHPFIGNLYQILGYFGRVPGLPLTVYLYQAIHGYTTVFSKEHDLFCGSVGLTSYVGFSKARSVEVLLTDTNEINKTEEYELMKPWLGTGLLTSGRDKWKRQRKLLTPSFHFRILEKFQPIMSEQAEILVNKFRQGIGKNFINIDSLISDCTFDMITETAFGVKAGAQSKTGSPIVEAVSTVTAGIFERILTPWLWIDSVYPLFPAGRKFYQSLNVVRSYVRKIIREKEEQLSKESDADVTDSEGISLKCRAFLELLLLHNLKNSNEKLTYEQIEDEVHTFNFAGYDTTAISIIWILYMLGLHPEVQRKVQEELDDVFSEDRDSLVTMEHIKKMSYLERVIKETQRLYPAVSFIARRLQDDLNVNGVTIPKGCTCIVLISSLHRDPEVFPNPEKFDPDRFLETNRNPFAFIPFSAGPRNCIGQRFAMIEMKTVVASLLRKYTFTSLDPRDKVLVQPELTSRSNQPIRQKVELRI